MRSPSGRLTCCELPKLLPPPRASQAASGSRALGLQLGHIFSPVHLRQLRAGHMIHTDQHLGPG